MIPEERYTSDIVVEYSFINGEDANYVGLAKQYQKSLVEDGVLGKATLSKSTQMHTLILLFLIFVSQHCLHQLYILFLC